MRDDDATLDDANATDEGRRGRRAEDAQIFSSRASPFAHPSRARARGRALGAVADRPDRSPRAPRGPPRFHWLVAATPYRPRRGRRRDVDGWMACGEGWGNAYRW